MAGSYSDIPAPRIEYDRDGTRLYGVSADGVTVYEAELWRMQAYNDESQSEAGYALTGGYLFFTFPYQMDISHIYIDNYVYSGGSADWYLQTSTDSTNGHNGTWVTVDSAITATEDLATTRYRTDIQLLKNGGVQGKKMIRLGRVGNASYVWARAIHLYGKVTTGQGLDRLRLWHPTLDQPLDQTPAHFDWGNVEQDSSATRMFRVKNSSTVLTANSVKVYLNALTETNPTQVSQHSISIDGGTTFVAASTQQNIGPLAPGALSSVLHLKRTTLPSAQLAMSRQRLVAAADGWA